jgi:hypothetical protein
VVGGKGMLASRRGRLRKHRTYSNREAGKLRRSTRAICVLELWSWSCWSLASRRGSDIRMLIVDVYRG